MDRKGFTLAEVLITLAVIGVVAAMTIPTLVSKYHEKQRITQLKKAYSVLNQAFTRAVADYGTPDNWGLTITNTEEKDEEGNAIYDRTGQVKVGKILAEYINCKPLKKGSVLADHGYSLDGRLIPNQSPWKIDTDELGYQLSDSTQFAPGWMNSLSCDPVCGGMWIILPGGKSKKLGVDMFLFYLTKKGIVPYDNSDFEKFCDRDGIKVNSDMQGRGCAGWVIYNENMDYLHCDDLSWDGKHKCD